MRTLCGHYLALCLLVVAVLLASCSTPPPSVWRGDQASVLVFSKTGGYRHRSIGAGRDALRHLGKEHGFTITHTEDAAIFTDDGLRAFAVVVFLNTTGDILNASQQHALQRYIQRGGGFVGVHAAADTEYDWPWYGELVGARFKNHPDIQPATLRVLDNTHSATAELPAQWRRQDEWYNFRDIEPDLEVLIDIDEGSYEGGDNGEQHPMAWYRHFDGGRSFYTGLGHTRASYEEPLFLSHLLGGLRWAAGEGVLPGALPDQSQFRREVLADNLNEPMQMTELPGEGILFVERAGTLKLYPFGGGGLRQAGQLAVYSGDEDGLLGVVADPDYARNRLIYLFYSAPNGAPRQHVSRFRMADGQLQLASEQLLLEIPTQHACCHSGGALVFGPAGNLYIGVGDNTNPFESDGFAPIDERDGRAIYDAQRSAANSNDLRGKILRIRPLPQGGYSIPEGNLFAPGTAGARPEIYAMGLRNPFRFSIDSTTGALFWGDIGPDAGSASDARGPEGMGELNRANAAGFWGWPYSRGNNQPYRDYNFHSAASADWFDPQAPVNGSANNSGLRELPPTQASLLWYSYERSEAFPWLGAGGVNPMAGPVFRRQDVENGVAGFPDYFEGALFFYEWMRDWIMVLRFDAAGNNLISAEPFMPGHEFSNPMDMAFAVDGCLYLLEYGQKWFRQNPDARLNRICYDPAGGAAPVPLPLDTAPDSSAMSPGQQLLAASDCAACHAVDDVINGPSYRQIAQRYDHDDMDHLVARVISGGSGAWGERAMSAHPQLSPAEVRSMLDWILAQGEGHRAAPGAD